MKSDKHNAIRSLMDFLHLSARLEANKVAFSQFLGLSVSKHSKNTKSDDKDINKDATIMRADRFSFLDHPLSSSTSLVFRYRFPSKNRLRYLNNNNNNNNNDDDGDNEKQQYRGPNLATYTSILDEVTTLGLIAASPKDTRPGVSVTMQSQWGAAHAQDPAQSPCSSLLEEVDIVTTITKRGRTLAFVRAEVRDPSNNDGVICYFDHVKYLPVGWMFSLLFTPVGMWCLNLYVRYILPYVYTNTYQDGGGGGGGGGGGKSKNMDPTNSEHSNIMDSFQKTSDTTATFQFGEQHANGFGGLHGGVQAILMEYLGQSVAQNELSKFHLNSNNSNSSSGSSSDMVVECERLQISYQSSASRVLELRAHIMEPPRFDHPSVVLRIEILRSSNKKSQKDSRNKPVVVSEGILTFTSATFLMKAKEQ